MLELAAALLVIMAVLAIAAWIQNWLDKMTAEDRMRDALTILIIAVIVVASAAIAAIIFL